MDFLQDKKGYTDRLQAYSHGAPVLCIFGINL